MPTHSRLARPTALLAAVAVAGASLVGAAVAAPASAATPPAIDSVDYIADTYGIDDSVIETVTYERFAYLLGQEGRFAFLIGGAEDPHISAAAATIDEVAKASGVEKVYTFDPRLDGDALDIRTSSNAQAASLWSDLLTRFLGATKETQTPFGAGSDPYLFVYDSTHTEGGVEDRIVAALTQPRTAAELADPAVRAAYAAEVGAVLGDGAGLDEISQFEFYDDVIDARHLAGYQGKEDYGPNTIIDASDSDWRLQTVTYPELVHLLESDGDYVIFFGGTWCHNTRAVIKDVNRQAVANDVPKVYFFDLRLDANNLGDLHIRDTKSAFAHLYGDLVTEFFPNLVTQYVPDSTGEVKFRPGGDAGAELVNAKKLQVPYVLEYDRDRTVDGQPAPIVNQWIQSLGDGAYKEYMTEWWYVNDRPGRYTGANANPTQLEAQLAFADEAIAKLGEFFSGVGAEPGEPGEPTEPSTPPTTTPTDPPTSTEPPTTPPTDADPTTVKGSVSVSGDLVPGGTVTISGTGLAASTSGFAVELHSEPQSLGTAATNAAGAFTLSATIPASTPAGSHSIVVLIDGVTVASASVTVAAASSAGLASTGAGFVDGLGWLAVALIAGAAAAGAIVRFRAQRSQ